MVAARFSAVDRTPPSAAVTELARETELSALLTVRGGETREGEGGEGLTRVVNLNELLSVLSQICDKCDLL